MISDLLNRKFVLNQIEAMRNQLARDSVNREGGGPGAESVTLNDYQVALDFVTATQDRENVSSSGSPWNGCNQKIAMKKRSTKNNQQKAFAARRPVVFLNACEIGRGSPSLVGVGGLASSFTKLGAAAVIAPLWSVEDKIAHEIALYFYKHAKQDPPMPFAEILRAIRAKAYSEGKDSYAAYCLFGDPFAVLYRKKSRDQSRLRQLGGDHTYWAPSK